MKKWKKITLKVLLACFLTTTSIYLFAPWEYGLYYLKPVPNSIEQQVHEATSQGIDGIIVYVDEANKPARLYASGWHNRQEKIPAYGNALFKIASIGKLYEAAAIAKLVASNQLKLDQSLADYLPQLAERIEYANKITLRMLVEHRSGIPNFTDQEGFDWASNSLDVLSLVLDKPADFPPGTDYAYSNSNYLLLQKIMTETLGYPYSRFINNEILLPLGLNRTFFSIHQIDTNELMSGYYVGYDEDLKHLDQGYVASAQDVGIFLRALNDGSVFTEAERKIYASLYEYNHTGWVLGYSSIARYHRDIDTVVIQFTNTTGEDRVILTGIIYDRIMSILRSQ
ncbi:serine hydrolase domain-containing protein [Aliiglaciecola sp. 3_MG-2023]|uniref:serine hydrolase domain-containing protein n=1 Tax=Aliiglaciecola sp. 3_MG-2023 TaxID=3062644 RepID=UPI0026E3CF7F|nr:serine hydrolase domain-containing protein [Aliiglaciecola sp. 3_MG-2023]MDO6695287.1 serine hydrolase domain-containing protein [Aliiglaciecola sp. 3_MG-2023]